jgi:hypothetical protein
LGYSSDCEVHAERETALRAQVETLTQDRDKLQVRLDGWDYTDARKLRARAEAAEAKLAERETAIRALVDAADAAWQDLHDWAKTARGFRQNSADPDHDVRVPHQRGIDDTEQIIARLGKATEAIRTMLAVQR